MITTINNEVFKLKSTRTDNQDCNFYIVHVTLLGSITYEWWVKIKVENVLVNLKGKYAK